MAQQGQSLWRAWASINRELKLWQEELVRRPQIVAISKLDALTGDEEALALVDAFKAKLEARGCEVYTISAATNEGIQPMLWRVMELVKEAFAAQPKVEVPEEIKLTRVAPDKPFVIREIARYADGTSEWETSGGLLERSLNRFDTENTEAVLYLHRLFERQGVLNQLREAGVKHGDLVHVGNIAFAFEDEE